MSDLAKVLGELAEKLGTRVEDLAPHVVEHVRVSAMTTMICLFTVSVLTLAIGAYIVRRLWKWGAANNWDEDYYTGVPHGPPSI